MDDSTSEEGMELAVAVAPVLGLAPVTNTRAGRPTARRARRLLATMTIRTRSKSKKVH